MFREMRIKEWFHSLATIHGGRNAYSASDSFLLGEIASLAVLPGILTALAESVVLELSLGEVRIGSRISVSHYIFRT